MATPDQKRLRMEPKIQANRVESWINPRSGNPRFGHLKSLDFLGFVTLFFALFFA
jgi:hypothetical protein